MTRGADIWADSVAKHLGAGVDEINAFVALCESGERLRRSLFNEEAHSDHAITQLQAYETFLAGYRGLIPELPPLATQALDELRAFADSDPVARAHEDGVERLSRLDDITLMAMALSRHGLLVSSEAATLGARVREAMQELAPRLVDLSQYAADHELLADNEADAAPLHQWWAELAVLAPSRVALDNALLRNQRRHRVMAQAIHRYERALPRSEPYMALFDVALAGYLDEYMVVGALRVPVPSIELMTSFSSATSSPPPVHTLYKSERLSILLSGPHLVCIVEREHSLRVVEAQDAQRTDLRIIEVDQSQSWIELPRSTSQSPLHIRLFVDGEEVDLSSLPLPTS